MFESGSAKSRRFSTARRLRRSSSGFSPERSSRAIGAQARARSQAVAGAKSRRQANGSAWAQEEKAPPTRVGRGEFEESGANHTPRGSLISRPNPSGIGQRGRRLSQRGAAAPPTSTEVRSRARAAGSVSPCRKRPWASRRLQPGTPAEAAGGTRTMKASDNPVVGRWRIVEADLWDRDYLDLCGPASLVVQANGHGETPFGAMQASLDVDWPRRDRLHLGRLRRDGRGQRLRLRRIARRWLSPDRVRVPPR